MKNSINAIGEFNDLDSRLLEIFGNKFDIKSKKLNLENLNDIKNLLGGTLDNTQLYKIFYSYDYVISSSVKISNVDKNKHLIDNLFNLLLEYGDQDFLLNLKTIYPSLDFNYQTEIAVKNLYNQFQDINMSREELITSFKDKINATFKKSNNEVKLGQFEKSEPNSINAISDNIKITQNLIKTLQSNLQEEKKSKFVWNYIKYGPEGLNIFINQFNVIYRFGNEDSKEKILLIRDFLVDFLENGKINGEKVNIGDEFFVEAKLICLCTGNEIVEGRKNMDYGKPFEPTQEQIDMMKDYLEKNKKSIKKKIPETSKEEKDKLILNSTRKYLYQRLLEMKTSAGKRVYQKNKR